MDKAKNKYKKVIENISDELKTLMSVTEALPSQSDAAHIPKGLYRKLVHETSYGFNGWPGPTTKAVIGVNIGGPASLWLQWIARDPTSNAVAARAISIVHKNGGGGKKVGDGGNLSLSLRFSKEATPIKVVATLDIDAKPSQSV